MSRAPRMKAEFTYIEDGLTLTPPRKPADGFALYIGPVGKDWTTVDPLKSPSFNLGLLDDEGGGLRSFDPSRIPAVAGLPPGNYSAAVCAYIIGDDGVAAAFSDFAVAPVVPLDFRVPGAPLNLKFTRA